jgi:hypothetical protein
MINRQNNRILRKSCILVVSKRNQFNSNLDLVTTANINNRHEIYNIFNQKNRIYVFISTQNHPPPPIFQQRINLAEVSYLDLDSLQRVNFISGCIFSGNDNLVYQ